MNYLIIGNIASGKSSLAEELSKKIDAEIFTIDDMRREYSDGTFSGEFLAWHHMLNVIEHPQPNGNGIYEFSGTGKNAWFVRSSIEYSHAQHHADWRIVYCLCDKEILLTRCIGREYTAPIPYKFEGGPERTIKFMSYELQKTYGKNYWLFPEMTVRTDQKTPKECAEEVVSGS